MPDFVFKIIADDEGASEQEIAFQGLAAIEATISMNLMYFARHPESVCALACGMVKYDTANKNVLSLVASIKTAPVLIRTGIGLCIDIVAFDVAVRRFEKKRAWPAIIPRDVDGLFHVVTEIPGPNGVMVQVDPSEELERVGVAYSSQPDHCGSCRT